MQYGLLIPFEPLFPTSFQDWKNIKWDWHRSWIIWERRVRKRDSLFWKVRALLRQDMRKFPREPSEPAGRQGAVLCRLLHTMGDGPEIPGCWNSLVCVHQMLDLYLVLTSTSGSEGSRGFSGAAKFVGIFIHSQHWMTPSCPKQTVYTENCRRGKEECFTGMQRTLFMIGATFLTCYHKTSSPVQALMNLWVCFCFSKHCSSLNATLLY